MCGIAGAISNSTPLNMPLIEEMSRKLAHRGPDQAGLFHDTRPNLQVALATRRLAILDLSSAGNQPLLSEDGQICLAYNGEVYNHLELRRVLEAKGYAYRSHTDTETVLHAFEAWGTGAFERLNGMFAVAVHDKRNGDLFLARDRMGIKPLYFHWDGDTLTFASELKALVAGLDAAPEIDPTALWLFLVLGFVPSPHCFVKGIHKLEPGSYLRFHDGSIEMHGFRSLNFEEARPLSGKGTEEELRAALRGAVGRQLMSDVPVGVFLSGGLDSSLIALLARTVRDGPIYSFSVGYTARDFEIESRYNEDLAYARIVAERAGLVHTEVIIDADEAGLCELTADLITQMDEPLVEPAFVSTHYLARAARDAGVPVVLTGDGADELLGGYERYFDARRLAVYDRIPGLSWPLAMLQRFAPPQFMREKAANLRRLIGCRDSERYVQFSSILRPDQAMALLEPEVAREVDQSALARLIESAMPSLDEFPDRMAALDLRLWVGEHFNPRLDRISMRHSVEARVPFQDDAIMDALLGLPLAVKSRRDDRKSLLKSAFRDLLPEEILRREKQPFQSPAQTWLRVFDNRSPLVDMPHLMLRDDAWRAMWLTGGQNTPGKALSLWALFVASLSIASYGGHESWPSQKAVSMLSLDGPFTPQITSRDLRQ